MLTTNTKLRVNILGIAGWLAVLACASNNGVFADEPKTEPAPPPTITAPPSALQSIVETKLKTIAAEVARLRKAGKKDAARVLNSQLLTLQDALQGKTIASAEPEVHVVGLYEGSYPPGGGHRGGFHPFGKATVDVHVADRPVILVLCSYEPVIWRVRLGKDVVIKKVILSGYYDQKVLNLPKKTPVVTATHRNRQPYFYTYSKESDNYSRAATAIRKLTGRNVTTLLGTYKFRQAFVVGPQNGDWRMQRVLHRVTPVYRTASAFAESQRRDAVANIRFSAVFYQNKPLPRGAGEGTPTTSSYWAKFTPAGPIAPSLSAIPPWANDLAVDPKGPTYYAIRGHSLVQIDWKTKQTTPLMLDPKLPRLSWPCALTFDAKRRRLILASLGGVGYLYAYEPDTAKWSLLSDMNNIDLASITWSAEQDCFFGLTVSHNRELTIHHIDADGKIQNSVKSPKKILMRSHDGNRAQLISVGRRVALIAPPAVDPLSPELTPRSKCYLIDPHSGRIAESFVLHPHAGKRQFSAKQLDSLWNKLKDAGPLRSDTVMWDLAAGHDQTVKFLRTKIKERKVPDANQVRKWIDQLDDDVFRVRTKAYAELQKLGAQIEADLRTALPNAKSAEMKLQLTKLLRQITTKESANPQLRREIRAIHVLARIRTPLAVEYLRELSSGRAATFRARHARDALRLLGR